ncbi:MAG TPA: OmpA family protein [Kofleriaceae bacterium]|nr:OmpA family protein [Kofleriaceae bacterium]
MLAALLIVGASCGGAPRGGTSGPVAAPGSDTGFDLTVTPAVTAWKLDGVDRSDRPPVHVRGLAPGRHTIAIDGGVRFVGQDIGITTVAGSVTRVDVVLDAKGMTSTAMTTVKGGGGHYVVTDTDVEILDIVRFQPGTAVMAPSSGPILDAVAATLQGNPTILLVEVQSHTAEPISDADNLRLSEQRAEAVRTYLVAKGVAPDRLVAQGYGTTQPLVHGDDAAARAKNDRIAFLILKRKS